MVDICFYHSAVSSIPGIRNDFRTLSVKSDTARGTRRKGRFTAETKKETAWHQVKLER